MTNKYFNEQEWKQKAASKNLYARDFFMRALHKALDSKAENKADVFKGLLMKYFSPVTNRNKLANGTSPWKILELIAAHASSKWARNSEEEKELVRQVFPNSGFGPVADLRDVTYVYFFTRQDISYEQQLVQTAHAAAAVRQEHDFNAHEQHFIVFGVPSEADLKEKDEYLQKQGIRTTVFLEPDIGNQWTSLATQPIRGSLARRRGWFKENSLLCLPKNEMVPA